MTPLRAEKVGPAELGFFIDYCRAHREEHDESYLSERELASIEVEGAEDRAVLLRDGAGGLRGVAALMLRPELKAKGKARFRILHVAEGLSPEREAEGYRRLVEALLPEAAGLDWVYGFLPERARRVAGHLEVLGFSVERRSWLLARPLEGFSEPDFPAGIQSREARLIDAEGRPGPDAGAWCSIVNDAFARLAGHVELLPARLAGEIDPALVFARSWILLEDSGSPVGLVQVLRDEDDRSGKGVFLGPLAIRPDYQGRGLGRSLLRAGLKAAREAGFAECLLSVNSENEKAADLYLKEGFEKREVYVCWRKRPA